jgi:hypothetical protein
MPNDFSDTIYTPHQKLAANEILLPHVNSSTLEYAIRRIQVNQKGLKINGTHQLLVYVDDNILGGSVNTINKKNPVVTSKEIGLEVNAEKTKYMVMYQDKNTAQNNNIKTDNRSFARVKQFKYMGTALTNPNSIQEEIKSRLKSRNPKIKI